MERLLFYRTGLALLFYSIHIGISTAAEIDPKDIFLYQGVHGKPGVDFPTFSHIPRTTFSCKDVDSGYYADLETDCQVFHICNEGTKISFLCPNGTIFQQSDLICDWWFKVNCTTSPELYEESAEHLREESIKRKASRKVTNNDNRRMLFTSEENKNQNVNRQTFGRNKLSSDEAQIPQETASFVRDSFYNKNNIRNSGKYPNHRTTYSDLKDPKYFSKSSLGESSTTSSSIKPEIVSKQKAPINNGKPFTATTVEAVYQNNGGISRTSTTRSHSSSPQKKTTVYVNTKPYSTTRSFPRTTTQSPVIRIALNNKQNVLRNITASSRNSKESKVVNIVTLPPVTEKAKVDFTKDPPNKSDLRRGKAIGGYRNNNLVANTKPFGGEVPPTSSTVTNKYYYITTNDVSNNLDKSTAIPKYKVSSPRPFISSPTTQPTTFDTTIATREITSPTEPTITEKYLQTYENVNNMITTLMNLTEHERQDNERKDKSLFEYQRPDLIIPPSVGPQTLHTLAVYFANALDSLAPSNTEHPTERYDEAEDISLLSQSTVRKYNDLFKQRQEEIENAMIQMMQDSSSDEDLVTENSKHAFDSPNVRQLAKVFTEALSSYLDDPVGFKKDLEKIRPTDPPVTDTYFGEDDEVLNFSDADIANKEHFPLYPSPTTTTKQDTATWGYILALNNTDFEENAIVGENLRQSNSKYYGAQSSSRKPKVDSNFSTKTVEEDHKTTSSFVNLFNTQAPVPQTSYASLVRNLQAPTLPTSYNTITTSKAHATTPPTIDTTTTYSTTNVDFTTTAPSTKSAVARLFNYFEQRDKSRETTQRTKKLETTPVTYPTEQITYPTSQTQKSIEEFVQTQRNIYADITKLNNLANVVTSPYFSTPPSPHSYTVTNQRFGKELNDLISPVSPDSFDTTKKPTSSNTYIPQNHRQFYSTNPEFQSDSTFATKPYSLYTTDSPIQTKTTRPTEPTTTTPGTTQSTLINYYELRPTDGITPPEHDVEVRFASLLNKATEILSNLHDVEIHPLKQQNEIESNEDVGKATAASLIGNTPNLPQNHWTTSSDVTKLWRSTLYVNPETLNQNLNATEETQPETTTKPINEHNYEDVSFEASVPTYSEVEYDLQALPKLELNSTQVHGVLIDFINSTMKTEHKLERFLKKLNTTEDEFLKKMQEIEKNPLTRRLILLLISECNKDTIKSSRQPKQLIPTETTTNPPGDIKKFRNIDFVQLPLSSDDQDARALDLLNSLYSIASKYGK